MASLKKILSELSPEHRAQARQLLDALDGGEPTAELAAELERQETGATQAERTTAVAAELDEGHEERQETVAEPSWLDNPAEQLGQARGVHDYEPMLADPKQRQADRQAAGDLYAEMVGPLTDRSE